MINKTVSEILLELKNKGDQTVIVTNKKFGITSTNTVGIKIPILRKIAKDLGTNHVLSEQLWETGLREARIIATLIADPTKVNLALMKYWANSADSWDIVDACCYNLFWKSIDVEKMIMDSRTATKELSKRFCFVLMACRAKKDHNVNNKQLKKYAEIIIAEQLDKRPYVFKAINWAMRQITSRLNCRSGPKTHVR